MIATNYIRFTGTQPRLDFSFLYPDGWQPAEMEEREYSQVFIRGPRNKANTYSAALVVNVLSTESMNLEEKVADYLAKAERAREFKLISTAKGFFAGEEAAELLVSYTTSLPLNSINPIDTTIIERRIIMKRGKSFYELVYSAVEEDYYAYLDSFENAARTFEFRDDTARRVYRPLVVSVPVQTLHEGAAEYKTDK